MTVEALEPPTEPDLDFVYEDGKVEIVGEFRKADGGATLCLPLPGMDEWIREEIERSCPSVRRGFGTIQYDDEGFSFELWDADAKAD